MPGRALQWFRRRGELVAYLASLAIACWAIGYWALSFALSPFGTDFRLYYASAKVAQQFGFPHIYDFALQDAAVRALGPGALWSPYLNPPALTALSLPLAQLPFGVARLLWSLALMAAIVAGWWLSGVGHDRFGRLLLFAFVAWFPGFFALLLGQPAFLIGAALVGAVWLDRRGDGIAAGAVLAAAVALKPQLGLLIPVALLCGWRLRPLAGFLAAAVPIAILSAVMLGPAGWHGWLDALRVASSWQIGKTYSLAGSVGGGWPAIAAEIGVVSLVAVAAWRHRSMPHVLTAGLLGSLLVTPYVSLQDFAVLAFPAWLAVAADRSPRVLVAAAALWLAGAYSLTWGPGPLLLVELSWLGWLAIAPVAGLPQPARRAGELARG